MEEKKILIDEEFDNVVGGMKQADYVVDRIVVANKGLTPCENVDGIRRASEQEFYAESNTCENVDGIRFRRIRAYD